MGKPKSDLTKSVIFCIKSNNITLAQIRSRMKWASKDRVASAIMKLKYAGKIRSVGIGKNAHYELMESQ